MASPMEQFQIKKVVDLPDFTIPGVGTIDMAITNSSLAMFVAAGLLITFFAVLTAAPKVVPGRFQVIGEGVFTFIDDLVEGFRLCGTVPAAKGRTYILAGPRYTTLEELVGMVAKELGVAPPRLHLPVWPFWTAGLLCETICVPLRIEPPIFRRRVDFYTKSRAFDISRARNELGYAPRVGLREGIRRTLEWYRRAGWL